MLLKIGLIPYNLQVCIFLFNLLPFSAFLGAHMRRASADLEKRRASVGAAGRSFRGDGTLDPHHAAILFRDSRGVSKDAK